MAARLQQTTTSAQGLLRLVCLLILLSGMTISCSDSGEPDSVDQNHDVISEDPTDVGNAEPPVFQVYSETGESGMQVTYSPSSLSALTTVEELEQVYADLMACVGITSANPPALLFTNDESQFYQREDGVDVRGYYSPETDSVHVHADDIQPEESNRYWWTRHGMIGYLIDVHGLNPDSDVSPFLACHWAVN